MECSDYIIVGGGIVGLATAYKLQQLRPGCSVTVLEKEAALGLHQTGHNSGVLHTGIYYRPGSAKALNCTSGRLAMVEFCQEHDIPHEICGKVIVATRAEELPRMEELARRAVANGLRCESIGAAELNEIEPHVNGVAALRVPDAGIVDYGAVVRVLGKLIQSAGGTIQTECKVTGLRQSNGEVVVQSSKGEFTTGKLINCSGLHSDRVMASAGMTPPAQIVPFRGEYYMLREASRRLCRHLIYPVPDPAFPFLGVHFTRTVDGHVEAGPNAVLAFAREGYTMGTIRPRDLLETFAYKGFRRMAAKHWKMGLGEIWRSLNKGAFVRALQNLVPEVHADDLERAPAGVRAQAVTMEGGLADDFLIEERGDMIHVCNAPSPAATSSLSIGGTIAEQVARP
jgi:(S)-2-hydroxyglutarate dehydrogenase